MVLALAATSLIGFTSLGANAGQTGDTTDPSVTIESGNNNAPDVTEHPADEDGGMDKSPDNTPPDNMPPGGKGDNGKNEPPPQPPSPPTPSPRPNGGGGVSGGDGGFNQMARRIACYNGYQIIMVRDIRECGFGIQRRVAVGGGYRVQRPRARYAYNGGYSVGGGYAVGGGYSTGGGYGYAYPQPVIRYYKPASRAAVMQAQKRARRAAQYSYGAAYGYDNGGYAVGGYGYDNGGYPAGYGAQMGYGEGYVGGRRLKAKRAHRRHAQAYGMMGGYNAGYGYDAGYGAGFGYGGTTIHFGPVMTKDGAY